MSPFADDIFRATLQYGNPVKKTNKKKTPDDQVAGKDFLYLSATYWSSGFCSRAPSHIKPLNN